MNKITTNLSRSIKLLAWLALASYSTSGFAEYKINDEILNFKATEDMIKNVNLTRVLLQKYHFNHPSAESSYKYQDIFDGFIGYDAKLYLTQAEYQQLKDNFIKENPFTNSSFTNVIATHNFLTKKLFDFINYKQSLLDKLDDFMDLETNEKVTLDFKKRDYPKDQAELENNARKDLIFEVIQLKLDEPTISWEKVKERLTRRYNHTTAVKNRFTLDKLQTNFMNSFLNRVDAHSSYYSQSTHHNFIEQINAKFEGIGAVLNFADTGEIKIVELIEGGPADKAGDLKVDDYILGVGQQKDKIEPMVGYASDQVIDRIKGPKGTKVYLEVQRAGSPNQIIEITRGTVFHKGQVAKLEKIEVDGKPVGLLKFGSFYRGLTNDVTKFLKESPEITGLIIDLRNNGGGLVDESASLLSMLLGKAGTPLVLSTYSKNGASNIINSSNRDYYFTKPVILMVNRQSASASEIVSGVLKDYHRALLVGDTTYGKGTMQNVYSIASEFGISGDLGYDRITIGKFYRVNGSSTQFNGILPDIKLLNTTNHKLVGEATIPYTLPHDSIKSANFEPLTGYLNSANYANYQKLVDKFITQSMFANYLIQEQEHNKTYSDMVSYPLSYNFFKSNNDFNNKIKLDYANLNQKLEQQPEFKSLKDFPKEYKNYDLNLELTKIIAKQYFKDQGAK